MRIFYDFLGSVKFLWVYFHKCKAVKVSQDLFSQICPKFKNCEIRETFSRENFFH